MIEKWLKQFKSIFKSSYLMVAAVIDSINVDSTAAISGHVTEQWTAERDEAFLFIFLMCCNSKQTVSGL